MNLVFSKNDENEITVSQVENGTQTEFNYVDLVKSLMSKKELDLSSFDGDFSEAEKTSVNSMVKLINAEVEKFYTDEAEDEASE